MHHDLVEIGFRGCVRCALPSRMTPGSPHGSHRSSFASQLGEDLLMAEATQDHWLCKILRRICGRPQAPCCPRQIGPRPPAGRPRNPEASPALEAKPRADSEENSQSQSVLAPLPTETAAKGIFGTSSGETHDKWRTTRRRSMSSPPVLDEQDLRRASDVRCVSTGSSCDLKPPPTGSMDSEATSLTTNHVLDGNDLQRSSKARQAMMSAAGILDAGGERNSRYVNTAKAAESGPPHARSFGGSARGAGASSAASRQPHRTLLSSSSAGSSPQVGPVKAGHGGDSVKGSRECTPDGHGARAGQSGVNGAQGSAAQLKQAQLNQAMQHAAQGMQERGDNISTLQVKSGQLADTSENFLSAARRINERLTGSWF